MYYQMIFISVRKKVEAGNFITFLQIIFPLLALPRNTAKSELANKILIGENRQEKIMRKRKHTCNKSNQDRGNRVTIDVREKRKKNLLSLFFIMSFWEPS